MVKNYIFIKLYSILHNKHLVKFIMISTK